MATIERNEVLETVCRHLAEILEISAADVSETQTLADDLGADSIALIELVDSLEQEFSDSQLPRNISQCMHVHHTASKICQFSFGHVTETMKCHISNNPTKNGIAKKFETLICLRVTIFSLP